jgi:hypothetical protein
VPRTLAGLLAAVGAVASGLAGMVHGPWQGAAVGGAAATAAALAYASARPQKTSARSPKKIGTHGGRKGWSRCMEVSGTSLSRG